MPDVETEAPAARSPRLVPSGPLGAIGGLVLVLVAALALREVASLVVPVIFGLFLALVAWPLVTGLERRGVRHALALAAAIVVVIGVVFVTAGVIALSVGELVVHLPRYQDRLAGQFEALQRLLAGFGVTIDRDAITSIVPLSAIAGLVRPVATGISEAGVAIFVLTLTMLYAMAGGSGLAARAEQAFGERHALLVGVEQFGIDLRRYLVVRAMLGLFAAILVFLMLLVLGVPLPALWAFLVFAASFIPNIGTIIALIPPLILGFLDGGLLTAVVILVGYTLINFAQDHFLQPVVMGSELNLSPLVVFLAVVAWAWILGAAGALLAVPLTVGLVSIMEAYPSSRGAAALLRNRIEAPSGGRAPGAAAPDGGPFAAELDPAVDGAPADNAPADGAATDGDAGEVQPATDGE